MTIEKLEQELNIGNLGSLYLLYGEEEFLIETLVKKIKKIFGKLLPGINYINIDETNIGKLISEIETPSFGFEKKLIIAKKCRFNKKRRKKEKK